MSATENHVAANLAVVGGGIYEAFGRGDIDFILGQIARGLRVGVVARQPHDEGRINRMRHYADTAKQIKAYGLG